MTALLKSFDITARNLRDGRSGGGARPASPDRPRKLESQGRHKLRSVWVSDTHLGTRGCKADYLLDFLRNIECDQLYLVGDIIDGWQIRRGLYWSEVQSDVVRRVLKLAKLGTKITYIPGNHDEALRDYHDLDLAGIRVVPECLHETANGQKLWVLHGDAFDSVVRYARWLAFVGDRSYQLLLKLNHGVNRARGLLGLPYWSLSAYLKFKVKNAIAFISRYEEAVAHAAKERGVDGVVCGHIHHAEIKEIDGITYYNDGDWVESCTALVEHFDGSLEIWRWADDPKVRARMSAGAKAFSA